MFGVLASYLQRSVLRYPVQAAGGNWGTLSDSSSSAVPGGDASSFTYNKNLNAEFPLR